MQRRRHAYIIENPMAPADQFDQVSVISDLHMGGPLNRQIFTEGKLLADFIGWLCETGLGDTALVINGDMVDFLADDEANYFDPEGAIRKPQRIIDDQAFAPVWNALKRFVATPRRHLVITLGNHDLELAVLKQVEWKQGRIELTDPGGAHQ